MRPIIVGLLVGISVGLVLNSTPGFGQGPAARPDDSDVVRWTWPSEVEPTATLVSSQRVGLTITLTFRESSGTIKIVEMAIKVAPGPLVPKSYTTITLVPQR